MFVCLSVFNFVLAAAAVLCKKLRLEFDRNDKGSGQKAKSAVMDHAAGVLAQVKMLQGTCNIQDGLVLNIS